MLRSNRVLSVLAVLGLACSPSMPVAAATVIRLGTIAPEQSVWHDALLRIRQDWRDITKGEVELRIYAGGVLGGEDEMVRKVQRRTLDALGISGAGLPLLDDIVSCLNLPLFFDSYDQLERIRSAISPEIEASFERNGYTVLGWAEGGWVRFFARDPVRTPDDLKRQRLWTSTGSPENEKLLNRFGFQVVSLPETDMVTGLQTGLIDAIDVPPLFALLDRSYQEASNMTALDFAPLSGAIVVSNAAWARIPAQFHDDLKAAVESATSTLREQIHTAEREAVTEMQQRGLTVVELTPAEKDSWYRLSSTAYPELSCVRDYSALYQRMLRLKQQGPAAAATD